MVSIIYALVGFIMIVLLFRLVFRLFGANPGNAFVSWIYSLSAPLTAPFAGIFGQPPIVEGAEVAGVFEFATVVAIIVYGLVGGLLIRVFMSISQKKTSRV